MSVDRLVREVAAFGLPGRRDPLGGQSEGRDGPVLEDEQWAAFLRTVQRQRLAGFLLAAVDRGAVAVTDGQRQELEELHLSWCSTVLRLERVLVGLAADLDAAGYEFVVLKGSAAAHLSYPDPAMRLFGDNDLLIRPSQLDDVVTHLRGLGYERTVPQLRPGFDRRFGKGATLVGPDGDELDLHRTLAFGTFGLLVESEELFASTVTFPLGGRRLRALGPETRLLHACYHAAVGDPRPRYASVRDVAQLLLDGSHDTDRVLELMARWRAEPVIARAVALCRDHLGVEVGGPIVARVEDYEPTRRERRAVSSYVGANRSFTAKVVASMPYLPSLRDRIALLRSALVPAPSFVRARAGGSTRAWIRRGMRSLARGSRRSGAR